MKKTIGLLSLSALMLSGLQAQEKLNTWTIGLHAGHLYDLPFEAADVDALGADDMSGLNGDFTEFDLGYGIYVEKQFTPLWGVQVGFMMGDMTGANSNEYYEGSLANLELGVTYNFTNLLLDRDETKWSFFGTVGGSWSEHEATRHLKFDDAQTGEIDEKAFVMNAGAGVRYNVSRRVRLELTSKFNYMFEDGMDGWEYDGARSDFYMYTSFGVGITLGKNAKSMHNTPKFSKNYFWAAESTKENIKPDSAYIAKSVEEAIANVKKINANQSDKIKELEARLLAHNALIEDLKKRKNDVADINIAKTVYFRTASTVISPEDQIVLAEVAAYLKANKKLNATLTGYADKYGSETFNSELRADRANAVRDYLINSFGIKADRISTDTNMNMVQGDDSQHLNRKVEIIVAQ